MNSIPWAFERRMMSPVFNLLEAAGRSQKINWWWGFRADLAHAIAPKVPVATEITITVNTGGTTFVVKRVKQ